MTEVSLIFFFLTILCANTQTKNPVGFFRITKLVSADSRNVEKRRIYFTARTVYKKIRRIEGRGKKDDNFFIMTVP